MNAYYKHTKAQQKCITSSYWKHSTLPFHFVIFKNFFYRILTYLITTMKIMHLHNIGIYRTYMSLVVELVVGEFELVEAHHLTHPRLSRGRRVRVDVDSGRHGRVRVTRHHPLGAVIHIPARWKRELNELVGYLATRTI